MTSFVRRMPLSFGLLVAILVSHFAASLRLADHQEVAKKSVKGRRLQILRSARVSSSAKDDEAAHAQAEEEAEKAIADAQATEGEAVEMTSEAAAPQDDILEVSADKSVDALHMVMFNLPPTIAGAPVKVKEVDKGKWADKAGIEAGSEIVTINGKVANTLSMTDFIAEMKTRPVKLTVKPPADPVAAAPAAAVQQPAATPIAPVAAAPAAAAVIPGAAAAPAVATPPAVTTPPMPAAATQKEKLQKKIEKKEEKLQKIKEKIAEKKEKTFLKDAPADLKAVYEAAKEAGRKAGAEAAKSLMKKVKKLVKKAAEKIDKPIAPPVVPPVVPAVVPVVPAVAPAPAPFAWQKMVPKNIVAEKITTRVPNAGPPEPVPPSPLDALRAAMAVRTGMSPTGDFRPLLSPGLMDQIADMARGKLGAFNPGAAVGPSPAMPCGSRSPAPAPMMGPVIEKVEVSMTVKNMSFTALSASPKMKAEFEQSVKQTMAENAGPGVSSADVEVKVGAGSVMIDGKISPPPGVSAEDMDKSLAKGAANLGKVLVARVAVLPGIESCALGEISATGIVVKVVQEVAPTTTTTTTPAPVRHLAKPPKCAGPPPKVSKADVSMALAPFKPPGALNHMVQTKDGGKAWPLQDGGWAFQYPDMALRMQQDGSTRIVWSKPAYAVEYDESGISYHVGRNVVHRDTNGDLTYQQPTGTMHQEGDTLVYHWCNPNVIVYQTPAGFVYYDDMGMTYRSFGKDVTHYTWDGQVLYQGAGGVTKQSPDGSVTHWTDSGAIFRHPDGSVTYTPVGESTSQALSVSELGPDPFPGPELTTEDVMRLSIPAAPVVVAGIAPAVPGAPLATTPV